jgi:hypothetical protein
MACEQLKMPRLAVCFMDPRCADNFKRVRQLGTYCRPIYVGTAWPCDTFAEHPLTFTSVMPTLKTCNRSTQMLIRDSFCTEPELIILRHIVFEFYHLYKCEFYVTAFCRYDMSNINPSTVTLANKSNQSDTRHHI